VGTEHVIHLKDSRVMEDVEDQSVHLVVSSPPYWNLKKYPEHPLQLGNIGDYSVFLAELSKVWSECFRVLVPGGRLCIVVGDICLSRRRYGRHRVLPLHADIIRSCLDAGFDYLSPIIWYKISNVSTEAKRPGYCLGRPNGPNSVVKNEIEYILVFRKPGGYRRVSKGLAQLSRLTRQEYVAFFSQVWRLNGDNSSPHPASFPLQIPYRLIKMFSYVGDCVLDPFLGSGTTTIAAMMLGRNSIGYEVEPTFISLIEDRIRENIGSSLLEERRVTCCSLLFKVKSDRLEAKYLS